MEVVHVGGMNNTSGILGPRATTHSSTRSNEDTIAIKNCSEQNTSLYFVISFLSSQTINFSFLLLYEILLLVNSLKSFHVEMEVID